MSETPKIQDYALIGDGRCAALISRGGSLDWLCWPQFDSPSLFGALLDRSIGGSWSIAPTGEARSERCYLEGTNVLRTRFVTRDGAFSLTDFMPAASEDQKAKCLWPEQEIVRRLECEAGEGEVEVQFDPRPDFGRGRAAFQDAGPLGIRMNYRGGLLALRSDLKFAPAESGLRARKILRRGETADFSLTLSREGPAVLSPLGNVVSRKLDLTTDWWRHWSSKAEYQGPYRDQVVRSALALKLMFFAPSGANIAAPTTSLPERMGGDLNWDYRFCWLRDASFTARALFGLGYDEEGAAFISWLLHATRLTQPELRVLYDVYGERMPPEVELPHLAGYGGSRPVRVGNATRDQFQLDVYGEVVEAVTHMLHKTPKLDGETQRMLRRFGNFVCRHRREPDNGIWEPRNERQHFTHSRLMCWVALDRLLEMHHRGRIHGIDADRYARERAELRREIEERGWNLELETYTQVLGGKVLDATVLLCALHGFDEASSWRMKCTLAALEERLSAGPGLLYRYEQSFEGGEGAFAMCGFWIAEFLARGGGSLEQAHQAMADSLSYASDIGLFAEEIDPRTGDALGNFPQAFTHVGLINAALSLAEREAAEHASQPHLAAAGGEP